MLQINDSVGSAVNGSITAVAGSGMTSMSLAWIGCQPRIDEPSKPRPSSNTLSSISLGGTVKCCQMPRKSLNFKSIATAFCSFMNLITSLAFIPSFVLFELDGRLLAFVDGLFLALVDGLARLRAGAGLRRLALDAVLRPGFLDGIRPSLSRADAYYFVDRENEDLTVADATRLC